jgi:hypothetical protein
MINKQTVLDLIGQREGITTTEVAAILGVEHFEAQDAIRTLRAEGKLRSSTCGWQLTDFRARSERLEEQYLEVVANELRAAGWMPRRLYLCRCGPTFLCETHREARAVDHYHPEEKPFIRYGERVSEGGDRWP